MPDKTSDAIRPPAEELWERELAALANCDEGKRPVGWKLSPRAVVTFVMGSNGRQLDHPDGSRLPIAPKFVGDVSIVQTAVATLASDRALLLVGVPGTAKSMLSELLAAAISGDSRLTVQGTQGASDEHVRYSWSPALLIAHGHCREALTPSPLMTAMETGRICRIEELTRLPSEVSDALISILSEKTLAVPELGELIPARRGFNVIATANTRDRGVNEMSSALKRRFNFVTIPPLADPKAEAELVRRRTAELLASYQIEARVPDDVVRTIVTAFSELRAGLTAEGEKIKVPSTTLSTAEAVSVVFQSALHGAYFGAGAADVDSATTALVGTVAKEDPRDLDALADYAENHAAKRRDAAWRAFAAAARRARKALG